MPRDNAGTTDRASKTLLKLPVVKTAYPRAIRVRHRFRVAASELSQWRSVFTV